MSSSRFPFRSPSSKSSSRPHFKAENAHGEGEHDTEEHRAEVKANTERAFQNEIILDAIAEKEEVDVSQNELIDYIVTTASQYGMDPNQFAQIIDQSGQVPMMVSEVRRRKALAVVLGQAEVTDSEGNKVDLSDFVRPGGEEAPAEADAADVTDVDAAEDATAEAAPSDDPAAVKF